MAGKTWKFKQSGSLNLYFYPIIYTLVYRIMITYIWSAVAKRGQFDNTYINLLDTKFLYMYNWSDIDAYIK